MSKYGQYCPIAKALEILGDRWTLLIVRDLLVGARHFNALERGLPGIPRALLAERLRRLQQAGVIEKRAGPKGRMVEYHLTPAGQELQSLMDVLLTWGARWSFGEPDLEDLDPTLLMWWIRSRISVDQLPQARIVIQFEFYGAATGVYWLLVTCKDVSVCLTDPGFMVDMLVKADLATFFQIWLGRINLADALDKHLVTVDAAPALLRTFPKLLTLSPAAETVRREMTSPKVVSSL